MKHKKPWPVLVAIVLAILFGSWTSETTTFLGIPLFHVVDTLGTLFLNALTLVVVPLVFSSIISGISKIGQGEAIGRLTSKIFFFYFSTTLLAILIGLFFVNWIQPGSSHPLLTASTEASGAIQQMQEHLSNDQASTFVSVLLSIVPSNILQALSHGEMLGLIFFSILFGFVLSKIPENSRVIVQGFFQGVFHAMIEFTHIIMKFLPYGVFALVAKVFMSTGVSTLLPVMWFTLAVLLGLAVFLFVGLPLLLRFVAKINPWKHFQAMGPALLTAFSTSSSAATLPITIDCVEKRAGVSNRICSLVVPLGTSVNMSGSALYECVAAMFIAQAYGIDLSFGSQFLLVAMALITSLGVAGIPSASLVAILIILKALGLPPEGIGLFIAVDRLLDMCRTTVNVFSDSCCAVLVAATEGEVLLCHKE